MELGMITDELQFGERRQFLRKSCIRMIGINDYSKLYSGYLRDLGLGGAFVEPKDRNITKIGQELLLSIPFSLKEGHVNIQAKIAWQNGDGIGVWFLNPNIKHIAHP
jgi:Tfp pilus assembly protein PilZ